MVSRLAVSLLALASSLMGCGGNAGDIGVSQAALRSMAECPSTAQVNEGAIAKVCVADDQGNFYSPIVAPHPASPDGLLVVPAGRKLQVVYEFSDGYLPDAQDVADDAVATFEAPYALPLPGPIPGAPIGGPTSSPCCAEDSQANRTMSHAVIDGKTMTVSIENTPGDGQQVAAILGYGALYAHRVSPTCNLPGSLCSQASNMGFSLRFYVGQRP